MKSKNTVGECIGIKLSDITPDLYKLNYNIMTPQQLNYNTMEPIYKKEDISFECISLEDFNGNFHTDVAMGITAKEF